MSASASEADPPKSELRSSRPRKSGARECNHLAATVVIASAGRLANSACSVLMVE